MKNKERVIASLNHKQPDKIPYYISFTHNAFEKMRNYYGFDPYDILDQAIVEIEPSPNAFVEVAPHVWQDRYGVHWDRSVEKDIGIVINRPVTPKRMAEYQFPSVDPEFDEICDAMIIDNPDKFTVVSIGFSLFERAWTLMGMENLLMAMVADKAFANNLLDKILENNLQIIDQACAHDIDAIRFGDDWGTQTGLIMGAPYWREFIKPRIYQMYQRVQSKGKYVMIHSCGKVQEIFLDLIECGVNVFNPFQPEVMDVWEMKRQYGSELTFFGGISTQRTLPFGTPVQTADEVKRLLDVIGLNGGYIAAPAHVIPGDAQPDNIAAMIEVLRNQ